MQTDNIIDMTARRYNKISLWIIAALMLVTLFVMSVMQNTTMLNSLIITAVYSFVSSSAYGNAWKGVARLSPTSLTKFYLAAPAIRMMVAILVVVGYCLIVRQREAILHFVYIFLSFYAVLLIFDCIFFAQIEKSNKNNMK